MTAEKLLKVAEIKCSIKELSPSYFFLLCFFVQSKEETMEEARTAMLEKKGPITVYIAKYTYDPYQHSPNENPDAELPLNSGDYVLVYGEMDEVNISKFINNY